MNTIQKISLFFKDGSSDKEYNTQLIETSGTYSVNFQYGRRGSTLTSGTKTPTPVSLEAATKIYNKLIAEKMGKGYKPGDDSGNYISVAGTPAVKEVVFIPQLLNPIDESEVERYLKDDSFGAQEKKDGLHQPFHKKSGSILVTNKKGQSIGFPALLEASLQTVKDLLVDSEAIGSVYHAFDLLEDNGEDLRDLGYLKRYNRLEALFTSGALGAGQSNIALVPLAIGYKAKKTLYDSLKKKEGIVFKKLNATYKPGKAHDDMWKAKFYHELSARVAKSREGKRSVGLELLDGDKWVNVGNVTIPPNKDIPLVGSILEVRYLYAYRGGSLYQTTYEKPRTDVDVEECTVTQIHYKHEED
jgi:bifunctional non-homologous end joining protein LigD